MSFEEPIDDEIVGINIIRSYAAIRFKDGSQRTIYFARNYDYAPYDIVQFMHEGDKVFKKENNDTISVIRNDIDYIFLLNKEINKK